MTAAVEASRAGRRASSSRPRISLPTKAIGDLLALAVLFATGVITFGSPFGGRPGYVAAASGVLVGAAVAIIGTWRKLPVVAVAVLTVIGYFAFGTAAALPGAGSHGLPTADSLHRLALLSVQSWRDLLTVATPANAFLGPAVAPYLAGLATAVIAVSCALRLRRWVWALAPATAFLIVGILWGTRRAPHAGLLGAVFALAALAWIAWRRHQAVTDLTAEVFGRNRKRSGSSVLSSAAAAAALALAAVGALAATPVLSHGHPRQVLRDRVTPPTDLSAYASPLTGYRYLERDEMKTPLFRVTGLRGSERIQLAVLNSYDGNVYGVAGAAAGFYRIGDKYDSFTPGRGTEQALKLQIMGYDGPWLPGGGDLSALKFTGSGEAAQQNSLYYNPDSGTAVTTATVGKGAAYDVTLTVPQQATAGELRNDVLAPTTMPPETGVPDVIAKLAQSYAGNAGTPYEQLVNIARRLRTTGYYSNGSDGLSRAGHTTERITAMFAGSQIIGDDEQYAVAMALMARQLGTPARVVMGFYPARPASGAPLTVTGAEAHVWVEVDFAKYGWIPFDPTPNHSRVPKVESPTPKPRPKPNVLPPPQAPVHHKDELPQSQSASSGKQKKHKAAAGLTVPWALIGGVAAGAAVVAAPFLLIIGWKSLRRSRRRNRGRLVDRVSNGWSEFVDGARDLGFRTQRNTTRRETAQQIAQRHPTAGSVAVAERVDASVYGSGEPSTQEVEAMWQQIDEALGGMRASVPAWRRLLSHISLRSLAGGRR
ncbi:transglutaminase-like domain-containing protein [Flexivirga caeni]|uniref:Transglutaminase domain-containing protein n=1 Tax=Flexivirga caeni TaxID=2294115 RepID=A0A3M9MBQ0_9MICO|nr:transglutaminase-like domain-containing protein [Flexivirga caeni]RNI22283.1 transglutaminase domain-containing protein [Flexivirga caeni]